MYVDVKADNPCFLRLNGTNKFGCTCKLFSEYKNNGQCVLNTKINNK